MTVVQLGPLSFEHGRGSIFCGPWASSQLKWSDVGHGLSLGAADDDLVAIEYVLEPPLFDEALRLLHPSTRLGGVLNACHFDAPEDHPDGAEFPYLAALVNDFRDINDDLNTLSGVNGSHFKTLLSWQPRIDPARTALIALIALGSRKYAEGSQKAAALLAETFRAAGYDGVLFSAETHDARDLGALTDFATWMRCGAEIPLMLATSERVAALPAPFVMNFTIQDRMI